MFGWTVSPPLRTSLFISLIWSQQLEIAIYTAPNSISQTVANHDLKLVPQSPPPAGKRHWIDVSIDTPVRR